MKETPQQYAERILGYVEGKQPLVVQAATAKKLNRLIKGVSTAKLHRRPAPDKWSVSEIIAHLADAEIVGAFRLRFILGSRKMGNKRTLRPTRSAEIGGALLRAPGMEHCAT